MNGAVYESTMNIFFKLKFAKVYDAMLATPVGVGDVALGEIAWCLIRGAVYAIAFLVVMIVHGPGRELVGGAGGPGAVLIGFAFAAVGMAATTFMRSWTDFDLVTLAIVPLFLFSATFYPLSTYPDALQFVVQLTPLYHGVDLLRSLTLGDVGPGPPGPRRLPAGDGARRAADRRPTTGAPVAHLTSTDVGPGRLRDHASGVDRPRCGTTRAGSARNRRGSAGRGCCRSG